MRRTAHAAAGERAPALRDWLRLVAGGMLLALVVLGLASGLTPPGRLGDVLRHSRAAAIDASPLFYTEVERMAQLEAAVRAHRTAVRDGETPRGHGDREAPRGVLDGAAPAAR